MVLPTTINDPCPFVSQGPNRYVVFVATLPLPVVVGSCPARPDDRTLGKFVKALADELRARQTAVYKFGLAAALSHRRDPGEALDFLGASITLAISAKGG